MNIVGEENYDANATPLMMKQIYEKAERSSKKNFSLKPIREQENEIGVDIGSIKSKGDKIHKLLNFLAETDKIWNEQQMIEQTRECFVLVNTSLESLDTSSIKDKITTTYYQEIQERINEFVKNKQSFQIRNLTARDAEIVLVRNFHDKTKDEFISWVSGQGQRLIIDNKTNKL